MFSIRKISFFVGLPIAAIALALFVMSLGNGAPKTNAASPNENFDITSTVGGGCDSDGLLAKCNVGLGATFTVLFNLTSQQQPWAAYDGHVTYAGSVSYVTGSITQQGGANWPGCTFPTSDAAFTPGDGPFGCATGGAGADQTYTGQLATLNFTCAATPGVGTITLVNGAGQTDTVGSNGTDFDKSGNESLTINCVPAPTATPVPPTSTPPPQPRVQKVCSVTTDPDKLLTDIGVTTPLGSNLCNHFLEREGAKIPPLRCEDSNNQVNLEERINIPISTQDPKDSSLLQQLAAFEFEVRFDEKLVCVSMVAGPAWEAAGALCSTLTAEGIVRFGCVTIGKGAGLNDSVPDQPLAIIQVRPSEELVNILRPNQDNGIPVQIMNQGCELADEQGHVIPIFSCEDLDITFRFLEGDVDGPDCDVDITDAQNVAFRWGANQGSLLYNTFMDLEPSGQVKGDGDIDIKDLQFVFGRMPSTCANPWPPQPPVNPKA